MSVFVHVNLHSQTRSVFNMEYSFKVSLKSHTVGFTLVRLTVFKAVSPNPYRVLLKLLQILKAGFTLRGSILVAYIHFFDCLLTPTCKTDPYLIFAFTSA